MTPDELPALLRAIQARALDAAVPVANAIAETYERHLVNFTLVESGAHGPATAAGYPPAAPSGRPPMTMTGRLRDTVIRTAAAGGGGVASAVVAPTAVYAATQEWGGVHTGDMWLWVRYVGPAVVEAKGWRKQHVTIHPHPYMRTAVAETFATGSLSRAAVEAFMREVWA